MYYKCTPRVHTSGVPIYYSECATFVKKKKKKLKKIVPKGERAKKRSPELSNIVFYSFCVTIKMSVFSQSWFEFPKIRKTCIENLLIVIS